MKDKHPVIHTNLEHCVDEIISRLGNEITLGIPLGIGKPNQLVNALYQRAKKDASIKLNILSALTLEKPKGKSLLEKRFIEPFADRVFGEYPDLDYELDRNNEELPSNVRVIEFYFPAGKFMHNNQAQQNYISTNYTHVVRDILDRGVNLVAQLIAESADGQRISLSSNADVTPDIIRSSSKEDILFVGQVNNNLPYMFGEADMPSSSFDIILRNPQLEFKLFGPPKMSVSDIDYMIGLHASTLIKDDGELQIGIGSLGDSLIYALKMRHEHNDLYKDVLKTFSIESKFQNEIQKMGSTGPFDKGLFGATEMLVDSLMFLVDAGIMKKKVYDDIILQRLLNEGLISENEITPETLYLLLQNRAIHPRLSKEDFDFLQRFGIFKDDLKYEHGKITINDEITIEADLNQDDLNEIIVSRCLGEKLINGAIIHAGFFLGPGNFYEWLKKMPEEERRQIHMKSVRKINQLYGHEEIDRLHRKNARFVNTCLMMTLSGAAVSDGLEDGRVVSGVGGQYNFVDMAHALPDGRSIIQLRSTRKKKDGRVVSNIVWNYGHQTIPRHLRDLVITEYGIADIRGKTDEEIIIGLIQIADSRFQQSLIDEAKNAGKLSMSYSLPEEFKNNNPSIIKQHLSEYKKQGHFPVFPFGTDFTDEEQLLGKALKQLKAKTSKSGSRIKTIAKAMTVKGIPEKLKPFLERMGLVKTLNYKEKLFQKLLVNELNQLL